MSGSFAFFLLICALFGIAGGLQGRAKGSSFLVWFMISAGVPLFGFIASVVYPGREAEPRRRCPGCGRILPISDTTCMRCGTDLDFPAERFPPPGVRPAAPPAESRPEPVAAGATATAPEGGDPAGPPPSTAG
ncbi:hypothetical protein ACVU7I_06565 [Patulibacter sp. S7RM1-6]